MSNYKHILIPLALFGALAVSGCSRGNREFVIGIEVDYPPWSMIDATTGEHRGFDVELSRKICEKLGFTPVYKAITWAKKKELLEAGEIESVWGGFTTNGRERDFEILGPYFETYYVFVAMKSAGIRKFRDLDGKVVGCEASASQEELIDQFMKDSKQGGKVKFPRFERVVRSEHGRATVNQLERGIVDTALFEIDFAEKLCRESKGAVVIVPGEKISPDWCGAGFRKGNTEMRDRFAKAILELEREGVVKELAEKYFGGSDRWSWRGGEL